MFSSLFKLIIFSIQKDLSSTGFSRTNFDYKNYFESLHLPESTGGVEDFTYVNVPGDDQLGDYRDFDVDYVPIQGVRDITTISTPCQRSNLL